MVYNIVSMANAATLPVHCESCPTLLEGVFCRLSPERLRELDQSKAYNRYNKGQIIFDEGNPALGVYSVYRGQVKLYKAGSQGRPQIIGIAKAGALMGHRALLTEKPHTFTAEALVDSQICFIEGRAFLSLLAVTPALAQALLKRLAQDLDDAEERLMDLVEKPVPVRLARLLLMLKDVYGLPVKKGTQITLSLTREEMAEMIGTTQETTIRTLSQFNKKGLVRLDRKSITLLDTAGLQALVAQVSPIPIPPIRPGDKPA